MESTVSRRAGRTLAALVFVSAFAGARAEAGVIVLKTGAVMIGHIEPSDVKTEPGKDGKPELVSVTVHDPRPSENAEKPKGPMTCLSREIRWYDENEWYPTDEYFEKFLNDRLDSKWEKYRLDFVARKEKRPDGTVDARPSNKLPSLEEVARRGNGYGIRMPKGWKKPVLENDILVFEAAEAGPEGISPRVASFSVETPSPPPAESVKWIRNELKKLGASDLFDPTEGEGAQPKPVNGGSDVEWLTVTEKDGKNILALRQIRFRKKRTYFVSCYAHELDYGAGNFSILFRAILRTLALDEEKTPQLPDAAHVKVGQVYRWKSNVDRFQLEWEVTRSTKDAVGFRATSTDATGAKKTSDESERLSPLDPAGRLGALTKTVVSPHLAGTETVVVSGVTYECSVYEAEANGGKCRYWFSSRFPFDVKLVVADVVKLELAEIR